ncbi:MAG: ABC transporter substrate-binding protein [Acidobacteriota bacterium]
MMPRTFGTVWFAPAAACLLLAACGSNGSGRLDSIVISVPYEPETLDPHASYTISDFATASHFYQSLVRTDAQLRIHPCLARSWRTPDPSTWILDIEPSVTFHSGKQLSSSDVAYSIQRLLDHPELEVRTLMSNVADVRATGPLQVTIHLRRTQSVFLNKLLFVSIVPENSSSETLRDREDGTGPYRLVEWRKGRQISMQRYDEYWGRTPALRDVTLLLGRTPEQVIRDMGSGRSAFVQSNDVRLARTVKAHGGYHILQHDSIFVKYLGYDLMRDDTPYCSAKPNPFRNRAVRQAIQLAIDRDSLVRDLAAPATPAAQPVPSFIFGYDPSMPLPHCDPAEARRLLASAGFPRGFEVTLHSRQILRATADLVRQQLAPVGIRVEVKLMQDPEFFDALNNHDASFFLSRFGCATGDASDVLEACIHSPDPVGRYGGSNYGRYRNPTIDRAIEDCAKAIDPQERKRSMQEIMRALVEDLPWIPLYADMDLYAISNAYSWQPRCDGSVLAQEIALADH